MDAETASGESNIDETLKQDFWLNRSKVATYRKRKVGDMNKKHKTRRETQDMINAERAKVLGNSVKTSRLEVEPQHFLDDIVMHFNARFAYDHY